MAYIEFVDLNKSYGNNKVLKNINLSIEKNDFVTLLGSSGCGKTTLLRCLAGLETIDSGKIILDGEDITYKNPRDRNLGMIFQSYALFPTMNVFNNVAYGLKIKKTDEETIEKEVLNTLESVGLGDKVKSYPSQLSGGEKQRVALARSIVMKPKVLLLDEPFSAIDAKLRRSLQIKFKELHKEYGMTSIMVTHDQDEAMFMSDTIHLMKDGNVEQSGSPTDLYLQPKTQYVASFMGNYNILSGEEFSRLTKGKYMDSKSVVLRPETIEILLSKVRVDENKFYQFEGVIDDYIPQGNIVRFIILIEGVKLNVDALIDNISNFSIGQKVYLNISLEKILYFD